MKPCSRFIHIWRSAGLNQLCTPVYLLRFTAMASGSALRPVLTQAKEAVDAIVLCTHSTTPGSRIPWTASWGTWWLPCQLLDSLKALSSSPAGRKKTSGTSSCSSG